MSSLTLSVHPMIDDGTSMEEYVQRLSGDLDVTVVIMDTDQENAVFVGSIEDLETIVWRYVTPYVNSIRGQWTTPDSAGENEREDFEHFSAWLDE